MKRIIALLTVMSLVLAGCSSETPKKSAAEPSSQTETAAAGTEKETSEEA